MYGVRDEGPGLFGRESLTVWSGPFHETWEADALALPAGDGYMLTTYNGDKVRVACETPRTDENFHRVDEALRGALNDYHLNPADITV